MNFKATYKNDMYIITLDDKPIIVKLKRDSVSTKNYLERKIIKTKHNYIETDSNFMKNLVTNLCTFMNIETQSINYIPNYPIKLYFHKLTKFKKETLITCLLHHVDNIDFHWIVLSY